jgi:hypothetical protein
MELQVPFVSKLAWPAIAEAARTKVAIRTEARSGAFIGISSVSIDRTEARGAAAARAEVRSRVFKGFSLLQRGS